MMSRILLICHVTAETGIGHLSRLLALAEELKQNNNISVEFMIFGYMMKENQLAEYKTHIFPFNADFAGEINKLQEINNYDVMIFDLFPKKIIVNINELFINLKKKNTYLISIDSLIEHRNILDLVWIPSFNFNTNQHAISSDNIKSGWDTLLLQKKLKHHDWLPGPRVLILTGGSDTANLRETLPKQLELLLSDEVEINWVVGPFSGEPNLPTKLKLKWNVHHSPNQLDELITHCNYALSVYGISLFEVLQYGVPAVTFSPYGGKDDVELKALSMEKVAMVAENSRLAIDRLAELMNNDELAKQFSKNSLKVMSNNGAKSLSSQIYSLIGLQ